MADFDIVGHEGDVGQPSRQKGGGIPLARGNLFRQTDC